MIMPTSRTMEIGELIKVLLRDRAVHVEAITAIDDELKEVRAMIDGRAPTPSPFPAPAERRPRGRRLSAVPKKPEGYVSSASARRDRVLHVLEELHVASATTIREHLGNDGDPDMAVFNDLTVLKRRGLVEKTEAGWRLTATPVEEEAELVDAPLEALKEFVAKYDRKQDAAKALGVSGPYLSEMLLGHRDLSPKVLEQLGLRRAVVKAK